MTQHKLIADLVSLSDRLEDRRAFHNQAHPLLKEMSEPEFIHYIFEMNLLDEGYVNREWTTYEIPFLYVFENKDFYLKYHVFPPVESKDTDKSANIVHHHNNYLLTSLTTQGPGYHTMHFDKQIDSLQGDEVRLKLTKDFFHGPGEFSFVDSYEPHLVFNMNDLTTTLVLWSPDQKHLTDSLRLNPVVKPFKKILIKGIHLLNLSRAFGIADKDVYQWYIHDGKSFRMREEDQFGMYKEVKGHETNMFFTQAVSLFVQRSGYSNKEFLAERLNSGLPKHWHHWLQKLLEDDTIPPVFGKEDINVPTGKMTKEQVRSVCQLA